jgi:predicted ABC-type transport system involved in lysophospholipase L1 biosynthesis ATPase subunit
MSLLELEHVGKRRSEGRELAAVLDDVSLQVEAGDRVGVWGVRRSGKSTLLRVAAGVEQPDEGRVRFEGKDIAAMSQHQRASLRRRGGIGLVCAPWRPSRNKSTIDHVAVGLMSDGISLREARASAMKALGRVDVAQCAYAPTDELSQGELIRVRLAQQLVHEPRLLLIDEPAVLSSPKASAELYKLLWSLARDGELALVIASEELDLIQPAPRRMTIGHGRLRSTERPATVLPFPDSRAAAGQRMRQ